MDGILDWYWLGVALGLGVAAGIAFVWALRGSRGRPVATAGLALALAGGVAVAFLAVAWAAVALGGGAVLGFGSFRRLSPAALPAALVAALGLALVPAAGYLEGLAAPLVGRRLSRRAESRYAGLRVLAKD